NERKRILTSLETPSGGGASPMSAGPNSAINPEAELPSPLRVKPVGPNRSVKGFALFALALSVVFWRPLIDLARYAFGSDWYSHILLLPRVSLVAVALTGHTLPPVRPVR